MRFACLWMLAFLFPLPLAAQEPKALLERALTAHGGAERLGQLKWGTQSAKGKIVAPNGELAAERELAWSLPDRVRVNVALQGPANFKLSLTLAGATGWKTTGATTTDLSPTETGDLRDFATALWITTLVPVSEKDFTLNPASAITLGGQANPGLTAKSANRPEFTLHFDPASGRLSKLSYRGQEAGIEVQKETLFGEYKNFDGLWTATKVTEFINSRKAGEWTVNQIKRLEAAPTDVFKRP
jgi:hypothetical protein